MVHIAGHTLRRVAVLRVHQPLWRHDNPLGAGFAAQRGARDFRARPQPERAAGPDAAAGADAGVPGPGRDAHVSVLLHGQRLRLLQNRAADSVVLAGARRAGRQGIRLSGAHAALGGPDRPPALAYCLGRLRLPYAAVPFPHLGDVGAGRDARGKPSRDLSRQQLRFFSGRRVPGGVHRPADGGKAV